MRLSKRSVCSSPIVTMKSLVLILIVAALFIAVSADPLKQVMLNGAVSSGAVCLDGSAPGYYIRQGKNADADKYIVHLEGGGWCTSVADCYSRSQSVLGSSSQWPASYTFDGILSDDPSVNPAFVDWNVIFVPCKWI
jgi:hypothetical protein